MTAKWQLAGLQDQRVLDLQSIRGTTTMKLAKRRELTQAFVVSPRSGGDHNASRTVPASLQTPHVERTLAERYPSRRMPYRLNHYMKGLCVDQRGNGSELIDCRSDSGAVLDIVPGPVRCHLTRHRFDVLQRDTRVYTPNQQVLMTAKAVQQRNLLWVTPHYLNIYMTELGVDQCVLGNEQIDSQLDSGAALETIQ
jgi:hypothetical protein